jgi:hypothetical protein
VGLESDGEQRYTIMVVAEQPDVGIVAMGCNEVDGLVR